MYIKDEENDYIATLLIEIRVIEKIKDFEHFDVADLNHCL